MITETQIRNLVANNVKSFSQEVLSGRCPGFENPCGNPVPIGATHCSSCADLIDKVIVEE